VSGVLDMLGLRLLEVDGVLLLLLLLTIKRRSTG
jgi:hypothetical protein